MEDNIEKILEKIAIALEGIRLQLEILVRNQKIRNKNERL